MKRLEKIGHEKGSNAYLPRASALGVDRTLSKPIGREKP
jgi:hypothetical protein